MVRVFELDVEVASDGKLHVEIDSTLPPGRHHAQLTVNMEDHVHSSNGNYRSWHELPTINTGWPFPPEFTASRSQIYDEDF